MQSTKKGIFRNVASMGFVQIANYLLPLISVPIISRIIGPEKYGIINYAAAFVVYFHQLIGYGFDLTAARKISKDPENKELRIRVFSEVLKSQLFLFLVSVVIFLICLYLLPPLEKEKRVAFYSFSFCIAAVLTQNWLFQAMHDLHKVAILSFIGKLVFTVLLLVTIRKESDYVYQPLINSIVYICISVVSFLWAFKRYHLKYIRVPNKEIMQLLWTEKTVFFSMIAISLYTTTNTVILGLFKSSLDVGYYTAGLKLIDIAKAIINIPLAQALYPFIGKAFSTGRENGLIIIRKLIPVIFYFTFILAIFMYILGPWAINAFYGAKFKPSVAIFQILVFIPLIMAISNILGVQIMLNLNMDKVFLKITLGSAIFSLILNVFLVYFVGYKGSAIAWLTTEILLGILFYSVLKKKGIDPIRLQDFQFAKIKEVINIKSFLRQNKS